MIPSELEAELNALREKQGKLEQEVSRLRQLVVPANYTEWWNRLDVSWKILFIQNIRGERSWEESWRWANEWDVNQIQPTTKLWEKLGQVKIFSCALQRHHTKISSLQPMAHITGLIGLNCGKSDVDDLEPISHFTDVRFLDIYGTHVDDLRPIAGWSQLEWLNYQDKFSQDKDDLRQFPKLKSLNIRYSRLDDLSCLASLKELEYLNIGYTYARSLKPLFAHTNLKKIYMPKTQIPYSEIVEFRHLYPDCDLGFHPATLAGLGIDSISLKTRHKTSFFKARGLD